MRTICVQATSENRSGHCSAGRNSADSGSASRSSGLLGPGRRLLHVDPVGPHPHEQVGPGAGSQLALPARAGPRSGAPARYSASDVMLELEVVLDAALASATTRPSHGWGRWWSVPFMSSSGSSRRNAPELLLEVGHPPDQRLGVLGQGGPVAVAGRPGTRPGPLEPSGASHTKPVRSTADGTPRQTTACSKPA